MKQPINIVLAGALLALSLFGAAAAGPYEDGMTAFDAVDYTAALRLWRPLADQGNATAQAMLGVMYDDGDGVAQDRAEAVRWYKRAADQGNADGQFLLGTMYALGYGVPRDSVRADQWFTLAIAQLPVLEAEKRDLTIKTRDRLEATMTADQIAEAQRLAREWKPSAGAK